MRFIAALGLLTFLCGHGVLATESAPVRSVRATVTLIADTDRVEPGRPLHLALRFRLAPGWHTYWRNPGDAGTSADLDLRLPEGAKAGPILWPTPERLLDAGMMSYVYTGEAVLLVEVTPGAGSLSVEARASWLVCAAQCVPEDGVFRLDLPAGAPGHSAEASLIEASLARLPRPSPFAAMVTPDGTLSLHGPGLSAGTVRDAWFLPVEPGRIVQAAPQPVSVRDGEVRLQLKGLPGGTSLASALDGIVVLSDPMGQQAELSVSAQPGSLPADAVVLRLPRTLLLAFLAGMVLNAMPCVFPVLAMKALSLASLSRAARAEARASAASYTAGVIVAFLLLAAALLVTRAAGSAAGWGFQFQSPVFVVALCWLLFLIGLNLSGVFEVGVGAVGLGQGLVRQRGQAGSFFTGLLAVVVATPCTAPFMGAAIAAALAAPSVTTFLVFAVMGLGLAAPYVLVALIPGVFRLLPRPGGWMLVLKQVLAFPMYAAAAWLLWVASEQAGSAGVLAATGGLVLAGFGAWAIGLGQRSARRIGRHVAGMAALTAAVGAVALLFSLNAGAAVTSSAANRTADAFTKARFDALRAEGRAVFVDATAAWCVTCLVNERVALAPASVQAAFARYGMAYLRADWTSQNAEVTALLRRFGREGVPLYVVFPAARDGTPEVLPQVLTEGIVLDALKRAAG